MKRKITIWLTHKDVGCFRFTECNAEKVAAALPDFEIVVCNNSDEFKAALPDTYAAVVWVFKQEWFDLAPGLRWLITPAAGKDYFNVAPPDNVTLYYSSFHGQIMAETVLAMMLSAVRGILPAVWLLKKNKWPRAELANVMRPFRKSRVVIIGFGSIGTEIGRLAKLCGAYITGVKRNTEIPVPEYFTEEDKIISIADLESVLPDTEHLVLCLPGEKYTDNIIAAEQLALLPEYAWIYNVGRGNAVDENALCEVLNNNKIAGACLDVFKEEPLPDDSVLRAAPNLFIMPHSSAVSPEYMDLFADELIALMKKNGAS